MVFMNDFDRRYLPTKITGQRGSWVAEVEYHRYPPLSRAAGTQGHALRCRSAEILQVASPTGVANGELCRQVRKVVLGWRFQTPCLDTDCPG